MFDAACSFMTSELRASFQGAEATVVEPCSEKDLVKAFGVNAIRQTEPSSSETALIPTWLCGQVSSTFDVARTLALPPWTGVLAMSQRNGRGQMGRNWVSPPGNLYSALMLPAAFPFNHDLAALAVGALAAGHLAEQGVCIKWPNDLIMRQAGVWRKVGGLLVEERHGRICLGLGLNVLSAPSDDAMRRERAFAAGSLQYTGGLWMLWQNLACSMREGYTRLIDQPQETWVAMILSHMAFVGQMVDVVDDPSVPAVRGRFVGLAPSGGLRLQTSTGEQVVQAGSLRLPQDLLTFASWQ